jgi:hypothetical protein
VTFPEFGSVESLLIERDRSYLAKRRSGGVVSRFERLPRLRWEYLSLRTQLKATPNKTRKSTVNKEKENSQSMSIPESGEAGRLAFLAHQRVKYSYGYKN